MTNSKNTDFGTLHNATTHEEISCASADQYKDWDESPDNEVEVRGVTCYVVPPQCQCGAVHEVSCSAEFDPQEAVSVLWMPPSLRASHEAAGGTIQLSLASGTEQLLCAPLCSLELLEDTKWCKEVG